MNRHYIKVMNYKRLCMFHFRQSSINDSTFSLPNTTRNIAPKSHLLTTDNIFLSEKFRSESASVIKETKCGWK